MTKNTNTHTAQEEGIKIEQDRPDGQEGTAQGIVDEGRNIVPPRLPPAQATRPMQIRHIPISYRGVYARTARIRSLSLGPFRGISSRRSKRQCFLWRIMTNLEGGLPSRMMTKDLAHHLQPFIRGNTLRSLLMRLYHRGDFDIPSGKLAGISIRKQNGGRVRLG